jgi:hypothetical protein
MDRILTPQQENFLRYYTDPRSETFSNAVQSALRADYTENYANNITGLMPEWLFESIGDMKRLRKAEKNLEEVQNMQVIDAEGKFNPSLVSERTKVDMFIAKTHNKKKYSDRVEHTGRDGGAIEIKAITGMIIAKDNE